MSDETKLKLLRQSYNLAKEAKGEDRLTAEDVAEAKKVVKARKVHEIAKEMKGEDRITQADIKMAEKSIPKFSIGKDVKRKKKYAIKDDNSLMGIRFEDHLTEKDIENSVKTVEPVKEFSSGGDVIVGKGGDYIKDLID